MARKLSVRTIRGGSTKRNHHYSATGLSGISGEAESSSDSLKSTRNTGRISPKGDFRPVCFTILASLLALSAVASYYPLAMITFKMDFNEDSIRRKMGEAAKEKIQSKLADAGLANRLTITFQTGPDGLPVNLKGSDEDVAKAKKILGIE